MSSVSAECLDIKSLSCPSSVLAGRLSISGAASSIVTGVPLLLRPTELLFVSSASDGDETEEDVNEEDVNEEEDDDKERETEDTHVVRERGVAEAVSFRPSREPVVSLAIVSTAR